VGSGFKASRRALPLCLELDKTSTEIVAFNLPSLATTKKCPAGSEAKLAMPLRFVTAARTGWAVSFGRKNSTFAPLANWPFIVVVILTDDDESLGSGAVTVTHAGVAGERAGAGKSALAARMTSARARITTVAP
jgi:hypothetical protein